MSSSSDTQAPAARRGRPRNGADKAARAEHRRAAIRNFVDAHGITVGELARRAGLTNANSFYNFLNGHSSDLSVTTLLRICDSFPGTTLDQLVGREPLEADATEARSAGPGEIIPVPPPEPAKISPAEAKPITALVLDDLERSLQALRVAADIVGRDLLRTAAALRTSTRPSDPA